MSRIDPNGKEIINSFSFEGNLSVDELATLRTFRKSDENRPELKILKGFPTNQRPHRIRQFLNQSRQIP